MPPANSPRVKLEGDNDGTRAEPQVRLLNFKMARYKLDGTFLGWKNFTTQLQLCGGKVKQLDRWRFFGTDYRNK